MVVGLGLTLKSLCFFHLMTHALFKALLFLCVGVGIHTLYGTQDYRSHRTVTSVLPGPRALLCVANLALLGFPYLAGFYRKESILEGFYSTSQGLGGLLVFLLGVGLTTAYRLKLVRLALLDTHAPVPAACPGGGITPRVKLPLLALGSAAILRGFLLAPLVTTGVGTLGVEDKMCPFVCIALGGGIG